jgi:hypothetical protein
MRIQNRHVDEFNAMRPELRRRARFAGSPAPRGRRSARGGWGRAEIVAWARANGVRSKAKLWRLTASPGHRGDPSAYMVVKEFGSWARFVKEAFGVEPQVRAPWPSDMPRYIQQVIVSFRVETAAQYKEMARRRPDLFPPFCALRREFRRWSDALRSARLSDAAGAFAEYVDLWRRLGRWPTLAECSLRGIDLSSFLAVHGGKEGWDEFVLGLAKRALGEAGA